jgi:ANTAR domain
LEPQRISLRRPGIAESGPGRFPATPMADRRLELWGELAAHAAARGGRVSIADVCVVAAGSGQLSGAWVAAARNEEPEFVMCATDPVCERLAELQLTLGEGPCHDVLASAAPVLAADLGDAESCRRWPAFTPQAREDGVAAVFAFPLIVGAIRAGVLGLYRRWPGPLRDGQLGDLLVLADMATMLLLDTVGDGAATAADGYIAGAWLDGQSPDLAMHRAEIDQATGMLTVQLGVTAADAFVRLRAYAYSQDRRLADVASDIVARRLRLDADPVPGGGL